MFDIIVFKRSATVGSLGAFVDRPALTTVLAGPDRHSFDIMTTVLPAMPSKSERKHGKSDSVGDFTEIAWHWNLAVTEAYESPWTTGL
jgi:hypothetical protein